MSTLVVDGRDRQMTNRFRKRIRLTDWDYSQSAVYMVTICIADRTYRLGVIDDTDEVHLSDAGKMVAQEIEALPDRHPQVELDAFVVMPNHVHMLIGLNLAVDDVKPLSLKQVVGEFKSRTTYRYIKGVKMGLLPAFSRHLWQVDYYETIMRNEKWTQERRDYILNNPSAWRDDPEMTR